MTDTDGNLHALNKHLAEREEYDRHQELLEAEKERDELADRLAELEGANPAALVKPLVWEDFEGRGAKAQGWRKGNYLIQYWKTRDAFEVVESYPGHQGDSIGDGFYPIIEAAKAAAQADYETRILSALEVIDAQALVKAALEAAYRIVWPHPLNGPPRKPTADDGPEYRRAYEVQIMGWKDARTIRALADDPAAVAEIVERAMSDDLAKQLRAFDFITMQGCGDDLRQAAADRIEELQTKLAKAVEALESIAGKVPYADDPWDIARDALAELKGQDQ
jgi:hypothetical protein